jgi:hypothetical protein
VITDNFLLGVGFNNYKSVSLSYGTVENIDVLYCYNIFLHVLAETGDYRICPLLGSFNYFFLFVIKKLNFGKDKKVYLFVLLAVIVFLVYNFFNLTAFVSTNMLMFFYRLSFPLSLYCCRKKKRRGQQLYFSNFVVTFDYFVRVFRYMLVRNTKKGISFFCKQKFCAGENLFY